MSKDRQSDDVRAEYDFSGGVRGRHAERFRPNQSWYGDAVQADEARWLAEGLLQVQRLERELVTYFLLAGEGQVEDAGHEAVEALENPEEKGLTRLAADLVRADPLAGGLADELHRIAQERSWLVHGSFLSGADAGSPARAVRLRELSTRAERLTAEISTLLRRRFVDREMTSADFDQRVEAVRRAWPRPRAA